VWGFDGLRSVVTQALTIGMSGVARWGSDIGGYNSFGEQERLTPELLKRWIELGAVSGVMRTKRSGIALPAYERPQVFDPAIIGVWRRYAKLHTQLLPYIQAADAEHRATGLPLMRHGLLTNPGDPRAVRADDQFMFGPDLLAAPVLAPGERRRRLYAPAGRWVDLLRSAAYRERDGSLQLRRASLLAGRRVYFLPAALDELPLLVRAGAVIPLLPADVDTLADSLELDRYAVLGHSYGAFVALQNAVDFPGAAERTIVSSGLPSARFLEALEATLAAFEPVELRERVTSSWEREKHVQTQEGVAALLHDQLPFHLRSPDVELIAEYERRTADAVYSPEVLRHFANEDYGGIEVEGRLGEIPQPVLVLAGRHDRTCPVEAAEATAAGIPNAELVVFEDSGHMTFVEENARYLEVVRASLAAE
jgi:proline iminopeptidase